MKHALLFGIIVVIVVSTHLFSGCGGSSGGGDDTTAPTISSISVESLDHNSCTISWTTNENADSKVEYGTTTDLSSAPVSNTAYTKSHEIILTGLLVNTKYYYKVTSADKAGNSVSSETLNFTTTETPDTTPPAKPAGLAAQAGNGQVILTWTANSEQDLAGYNIYRSTSTYIKINTALITGTTYTDDDANNGTTYGYLITAVDDSGNESEQSDSIAVTPGQTSGSIEVTSTPPGASISIGDAITGEVTPHTFTGMAPGTYTISVSLDGYTSSPGSIDVEVLAGQKADAGFTLTITNNPPTACFNVNPTSGTTDILFSFDAGCSSDQEDGTSLRYRWDFENDGTWDTDWSGTATGIHQYSAAGLYTIKLEVMDSEDAVDSATETVAVSDVLSIVDNMVRIPGGNFIMGDTFDNTPDSLPTRTVFLDAYWMGQYEITNENYVDMLEWCKDMDYLEDSFGGKYYGGTVYIVGRRVLAIDDNDCKIAYDGENFAAESGFEDHPVVEVTWYGAAMYCNWLSLQEGKNTCYNKNTWECNFSANGYRLPTEAEWEKAAAHDPTKGGDNKRRYPWGDDWDSEKCNCEDIISDTTEIGSYPAGKSYYECYDMAGNVWEWCNDWWQQTYSGFPDPDTNPTGPATGEQRIMRGGGWINASTFCRTIYRGNYYPTDTFKHRGFRVMRAD